MMRRRAVFGLAMAMWAQENPYRGWTPKFDPKRDPKKDLLEACAEATAAKKRVVLDVGGEWCSWCHRMDKFLEENTELGKLAKKNFVWLKVNFSPENENKEFLAQFGKINAYPHLFVLDGTGKLLHSQDTGDLEEGKSYSLGAFRSFLKKWGG